MKTMWKGRPMLLWIGIAVATLFFLNGCYTTNSKKKGEGGIFSSEKQKKAPIYYDFEDILLPHELKMHKDDSLVYRSGELSVGVLLLSGRVEFSSLFVFFETNMPKDNWKLVSSFKSPRSIMLFKKDNRWCVINITEKQLDTTVEIWVAPSAERPT